MIGSRTTPTHSHTKILKNSDNLFPIAPPTNPSVQPKTHTHAASVGVQSRPPQILNSKSTSYPPRTKKSALIINSDKNVLSFFNLPLAPLAAAPTPTPNQRTRKNSQTTSQTSLTSLTETNNRNYNNNINHPFCISNDIVDGPDFHSFLKNWKSSSNIPSFNKTTDTLSNEDNTYLLHAFTTRLRGGFLVVKYPNFRFQRPGVRKLVSFDGGRTIHLIASYVVDQEDEQQTQTQTQPPQKGRKAFKLTDVVEIRHAWTPDSSKPSLTATKTMRRSCHYLNGHKSFSFIMRGGATINVTAKTADQAKLLMLNLSILRKKFLMEGGET